MTAGSGQHDRPRLDLEPVTGTSDPQRAPVSGATGADTVGGGMYRFLISPRWLGFHVLVLVGILAFINFGFWQLDRLDQRREFNTVVTSRIDQPAIAVEALVSEIAGSPLASRDDAVAAVEWRSINADGTYLVDEQLVVVNRSQGGRAGDNVVTPMVLADGHILLINRGFVPLGQAIPPPPSESAVVRGIVRASEQRRRGQLSDPADGPLREVQRIDIDRLSAQLPGDVLPFYIDLTSSEPAQTTVLPEPVTRPDLSEGPHLSYAAQWFIFATAIAIGWVLAVRYSVTKRRRDLTTSTAAGRRSSMNAAETTVPMRTTPPSST
jgi:surfeit locus 1 family protein